MGAKKQGQRELLMVDLWREYPLVRNLRPNFKSLISALGYDHLVSCVEKFREVYKL